ncbi:MAG: hypothetical protein ACSLE9_08010 [Burkholderiaceae bacterium]
MTMPPAPDPIAALVAYLRTRAELTALTGTRIFGGTTMPAAAIATWGQTANEAILITAAGSGFISTGGGAYSLTPISNQRIDIRCYGETDALAAALTLQLTPILKRLTRRKQGSCLLHWCNPENAAIALREPDTSWPFVLTSWTLQASELPVTA